MILKGVELCVILLVFIYHNTKTINTGCKSWNVIYCFKCKLYNILYVGKTINPLHKQVNGHGHWHKFDVLRHGMTSNDFYYEQIYRCRWEKLPEGDISENMVCLVT